MATASSSEDLGKLVLRLALGILMLLHGLAKVTGGVASIAGMLGKMGMPEAFAYMVYVGEVLAPILIIVGLWTRPAALVIVINMIVAVWLVHMGDLFQLTKNGGWALELQGLYLFGALALSMLGAGRYSIGGAAGKWN